MIEQFKKELNELIEECNYNLLDERVLHKSIEIDKHMNENGGVFEMKCDYCFKLDAAAEVAVCTETGEPSEAYVKISGEIKRKLTSEQYNEQHEAMKEILATSMDIEVDHITPITKKEYLERNGEANE